MKFGINKLLTEKGWMENITISTDQRGIITAMDQGISQPDITCNIVLPGFQNAHSHAFQYAMAGMAEIHVPSARRDDFWSWRRTMYAIALTINPDEMQQIATALYREMVGHGYTAVAEFHYLHHDTSGKPYANIAEMAERLMIAANEAGIRLTLIPMFYQRGNFGKSAEDGQRRFLSADPDAYLRLVEATERTALQYENILIGRGIHSLRAVEEENIIRTTEALDGYVPFHIHIAEQRKEVDDCMAYHGRRPVQWLLDHCPVGPHFHLVHATHLSDDEVTGISTAGANVVLCPSTEGNLGDGIFRFHDFKASGGKWSIGTDSHIGLNPFEELRILDYGQRLVTYRRDTFVTQAGGDSGLNAISNAWKGGRAAMGESATTKWFMEGIPFDAVAISNNSRLIESASNHNLASTIVYTGDRSVIEKVIIDGKVIEFIEDPSSDVFRRIRS